MLHLPGDAGAMRGDRAGSLFGANRVERLEQRSAFVQVDTMDTLKGLFQQRKQLTGE